MSAVSDGWVRDVAVEDTQNTITLGSTVRRVTLENVHIRHTVPFTGAASPADIAISGTQILVHRSSVSGKRVWPIVTQDGVTGPNVVLNFTSDEAGVAPHQRWATGLLVDSSEFQQRHRAPAEHRVFEPASTPAPATAGASGGRSRGTSRPTTC